MELEEVLKEIAAKQAGLTGLVETKFGDISKKIDEYDKRLAMLEGLAKHRGVSLPGVEDEKEKFSFGKAIRAIKLRNWDGAGFEKEIFEQAWTKVMGTGSGSLGGYWVPQQFLTDVIERLVAETTVIKAGATVLNDLQGSPVILPKISGGSTAYWVSQGSSITGSDMTAAQVTMTPHELAALVKLNNQLLLLSPLSVDNMVRNDIVTQTSLLADITALRGDGQSATPYGIANTANILTVAIGTTGGPFTFDVASNMVNKLEMANALRGNLAFISNPKTWNQLRKFKVLQYSGDTAGLPLILPMTNQQLRDTLGWDFLSTTQIPINLTKSTGHDLTEVYFANWAELLIGMWGGAEIKLSEETSDAFEKNQTWVRIITLMDFAVRHEQSFCLCNDANTDLS